MRLLSTLSPKPVGVICVMKSHIDDDASVLPFTAMSEVNISVRMGAPSSKYS